MEKATPITEQLQHFVEHLKESFWGGLNGRAQAAMKQLLEAESRRQRDRYLCREAYARREGGGDYRNGYYERDFVTRFGTLRLRIARTRGRAFLPAGLRNFQRRAEEVALLIREAFLQGLSTRKVGRVVAIVTGEPVSAQTVSTLTPSVDRLVKRFHESPLKDEWAYLFLDGPALRDAGAAAPWTQAGADAGGLRGAGRRATALAGLSAQPGRERGRLGRVLTGPLPAGPGRKEPAADRHRWV